jgi:neutral trehalase
MDATRANRTVDYFIVRSASVQRFCRCAAIFNLYNLQRSGALSYPSGIPASVIPNTNEQWDFPNSWAPINYIVIEALRKSGNHYFNVNY